MKPHPSTSDPIRVGFVGTGRMARLHFHALRLVAPRPSVVGVYDVRPHAAQEFAQRTGASAYPSLKSLLSEARPQVVHVCTPAGTHFEPARDALLAGAHLYVEKPFVETAVEARQLLDLARRERLLVCAGHQLLKDRAFARLMQQASALAPIVFVDSTFAFNPRDLRLEGASARALAAQLLDVLPHPLYTLIAGLETSLGAPPAPLRLAQVFATSTTLHALFSAGDASGRLCVSLRARPVASTLTISGSGGARTVDFVRSTLVGAANPGTALVEKIVNPLLEGWQLQWHTMVSLCRRVLGGGDDPGLKGLLGAFYRAVADGGPSPLAPEHLERVTVIYEQLAAEVRRATVHAGAPRSNVLSSPTGPLAVVTGARGFLGKAITEHLARQGFRVRGISRSIDADDPHVYEWAPIDLSGPVPPDAFATADIVVHAAAETSGDHEAHQRNTVNATRNLLHAMRNAGARRLIYVSSLSVLRPPRTAWERQDERTPLPRDARSLGPYTWGKCVAERLVVEQGAEFGLATRVVRPAALIDWDRIEWPGLLGRRLFGRWHLGIGRPGLPIAVCELRAAAAAIAWCAVHFDQAPPVVNLIDATMATRGQLVERFRTHGWCGSIVWVPISLVAAVFTAARTMRAVARLRLPHRLAVWSILRPRRYDPRLAMLLLGSAKARSETGRSGGACVRA